MKRVALTLVGLVLLTVAVTSLLSSQAWAAWSDLFSNGPKVGNDSIHYVVSKEGGSNLLRAQETWIKVYSKDKKAKKVTITFAHECTGTKVALIYSATSSEGAGSGKALGKRATSGCGKKITGNIPYGFLKKTKVEGHEGLYVGFLQVKISGNGSRSGFKVSIPGAKLGSRGLAGTADASATTDASRWTKSPNMNFSQAFLGYPTGPGGFPKSQVWKRNMDDYRLKFKPPCNFFSGGQTYRNIWLYWFDDDYNTTYQSTIMKMNVYRKYKNASGVWKEDSVSKQNFHWGGEGKMGWMMIRVYKNSSYIWEFKNVTRANGIQVWYPFDSADFDLDCPAEPTPTGWQLKATTWEKQKRTKIGFEYSAPSSNDSNAQKEAKRVANRKSAAKALRQIEFNHYLTNKKIDGRKHVSVPRARSGQTGCANNQSLGSGSNKTYCARIQQRVKRAANNPWEPPNTPAQDGGWKWRFGYGDASSNAGTRAKEITRNGFSRNIAKNDTIAVTDFGAPKTNGAPNNPWTPKRAPANDSGGSSNLDYRLDRIAPGDKYCERVLVNNKGSGGGGEGASAEKCVELVACPESGGCTSTDPYWNLKPEVDTKETVQQGDTVTPTNTLVRAPSSDLDWPDEESDIQETGPAGDGPEGEAYTPATTKWSVVQFSLPQNRALDDDGWETALNETTTTSQDPCAWVNAEVPGGSPTTKCSTTVSGNGTFQPDGYHQPTNPVLKTLDTTSGFNFTQGNGVIQASTETVPVGGAICFVVSVSRPQAGHPGDNDTAMTWRHSKASCTTVAKKPKVWFQNGDLRAGRTFTNSQGLCPVTDTEAGIYTAGVPRAKRDQSDANLYGSWVEYGAFATGSISSFGSAATPTGLVSINGSKSATRLSFANTTTPAGNFQFGTSCQPNYFNWVSDDTENRSLTNQATASPERSPTASPSSSKPTT